MKYRKKPVTIEAFCPRDDVWPEWFIQTVNKDFSIDFTKDETFITIRTLEGDMKCKYEDYIIKGVEGELYPCRRDIFLKTYEKIEEDN